MLRHVLMDKRVLRKWLKAGFVDKAQWFPTEAGAPQGGVASPTLANTALDGLEARLSRRLPRRICGKASKVRLVRYADDFVITGATKEVLEQAKVEVEAFLAERGLSLSPEKTKITHVSEGFDFLGFNVRTYNGKLLITPSKDALVGVARKIGGIIRENKAVTQQMLIGLLNPVIRGWAYYFRHIVAKRTFNKLDHLIWQALWRWAMRRHPNKGKRWVKKKYFPALRFRHWVFACESGQNDLIDGPELVKLVPASDTKIRRHVKVKVDANPYDPQWKKYFAARREVNVAGSEPDLWKA
jgi:RNA-directed DNA polymerase